MDMHKFLLLNPLCHDAVGEAPGIRVRFTEAWQNENLLIWEPHSYPYTRGIICTGQTRVRGLKYEHPIYLEESDPLHGPSVMSYDESLNSALFSLIKIGISR